MDLITGDISQGKDNRGKANDHQRLALGSTGN